MDSPHGRRCELWSESVVFGGDFVSSLIRPDCGPFLETIGEIFILARCVRRARTRAPAGCETLLRTIIPAETTVALSKEGHGVGCK